MLPTPACAYAPTAVRLRTLRDGNGSKLRPNGRRDHDGQGDGIDVPRHYLDDVPNPYEAGQREVLNYMGVVELCAQAAKLRATGSL